MPTAALTPGKDNSISRPSPPPPSPGGAPRDLSAAKAEQLLESVVPADPAELIRHVLAADLIIEIRTWDVKLKDNAKAMAALWPSAVARS